MLRILPGLEPSVKSHVSCDDVPHREDPGPETSQRTHVLKEKRPQLSWCAGLFEARQGSLHPELALAPPFLSLFTCQAFMAPPVLGAQRMDFKCLEKQGLPFGDWH